MLQLFLEDMQILTHSEIEENLEIYDEDIICSTKVLAMPFGDIENNAMIVNQPSASGNTNTQDYRIPPEMIENESESIKRTDSSKKRKYVNIKREKNKKLRMQGNPQQSYKKNNRGKYKIVNRPTKTFPPLCRNYPNDHDFKKTCSEFTEEDCTEIRNEYMNCTDTGARKTLLLSTILIEDTKTRKESSEKIRNRNRSIKYCLKKEGKYYPVCKSIYLST